MVAIFSPRQKTSFGLAAVLWLILDQILAGFLVARGYVDQQPAFQQVVERPTATILAVGGVVLLWFVTRHRLNWPVLLALTAAAASNALSFLRFGYVPDYIPLGFGITNNLSDMIICACIALLARDELRLQSSTSSQPKTIRSDNKKRPE